MSKKMIGYGLIVLGVIGALVSLLADSIGLGKYPGIHWLQIIGILIGVIAAAVGVWLAVRKPAAK